MSGGTNTTEDQRPKTKDIEIGISLIRHALEYHYMTKAQAAEVLCVTELQLDTMLRRDKGETPTQTQKRSEKEFLELCEEE